MAIVKNVLLMSQLAETLMDTQIWTEIALAIFKHYLVKEYSILRLFAEISVYPYVSLPLVP